MSHNRTSIVLLSYKKVALSPEISIIRPSYRKEKEKATRTREDAREGEEDAKAKAKGWLKEKESEK